MVFKNLLFALYYSRMSTCQYHVLELYVQFKLIFTSRHIHIDAWHAHMFAWLKTYEVGTYVYIFIVIDDYIGCFTIAFVLTVISKDTFRDVRVPAGVACKVQKGKSFTVNYKLSNNFCANTGANSKTCFKRSKFHYEMRKLPLKCVELADVVCYTRKMYVLCIHPLYLYVLCRIFVFASWQYLILL